MKFIKQVSLFSIPIITLILSIPLFVNYSVRNKIFTEIIKVENKEFAIVLGAGIQSNNRPGVYLRHRLDDIVALYKAKKIKKILLSGDNSRKQYDELSVMNNYLIGKGVPQAVIFGDYAGFDTYSSMDRAAKIFSIKNAVIVSQGFHLPRSVYIAQFKGIDAIGFATKESLGRRKYLLREWTATIKSFFDCIGRRRAKFYGSKVNTDEVSNIVLEQL
ncbi:SanA/YdcF family protein [Nibribacter koreensis]|uniref:Vancomycin high temperature exclusion protein n=1 Tax=Nibribacter koreensis TaxID=1084519 RepID=A0ABP8FDE0_9BACT